MAFQLKRVLAVGFVLGVAALSLPVHEYGHCIAAWASGYDGACVVTYAPPGKTISVPSGEVQDTAWGLRAQATGSGHWLEHPLIYGFQALIVGVAAWRMWQWSRSVAS